MACLHLAEIALFNCIALEIFEKNFQTDEHLKSEPLKIVTMQGNGKCFTVIPGLRPEDPLLSSPCPRGWESDLQPFPFVHQEMEADSCKGNTSLWIRGLKDSE